MATTTIHTTTGNATAIGDGSGFYAVLGESAATAPELARRASVDLDQVRDWLVDQVRAGYLVHDPLTHRFASWCPVQPVSAPRWRIAA